jgi:hypothetical protein
MDVTLEGKHIGRAGTLAGFAGDFVRDVFGEEGLEEGIEEVVYPVLPYLFAVGLLNLLVEVLGGQGIRTGGTDIVVHECRALEQNGGIIRESGLVDVGAVLLDVASIIDFVVLVVDVVDAP